MPDLVPLTGSERAELPGAEPAGELNPSTSVTVTVLLRRRAEVPVELITGPETLTSAELGERYGASPSDAALVRTVLERRGLTVTDAHLPSRRLKVTGTVASLSAAFGTTLTQVTSAHPDGSGPVTHRYRSGGLSVPADLSGIITTVLGLDDRPVARPQFRTSPRAGTPGTPTSLTALQVAALYGFPAGTNGTGQAIALIELGGGYTPADLQTYFSGLGLSVPSVTAVPVDGGANTPGQQADGEVELDIEVAGAVAPGATQHVYFAPNTDQGFVDAISDALHATPTPIVVSISWGGSEDSWAAADRTSMDDTIADAAVLGVTVTVAAGDNGSGDGATDGNPHCDFPASSPHALACGGTKLIGDLTTDTITSEVVWNETASSEGAGGGGVSDVFPLPSWQDTAGVPALSSGTGTSGTGTSGTAAGFAGRGVPDVAGNADPVTGYQIIVDGQPSVVGGTSAVAPLWAGLIARLAQATGKKFGLLQPLIYAGITPGKGVPGFNDITQGNNGTYSAGPGWDPCTGLGSPQGSALLTRLS
jgi:kumamolisin